MEHDPFLDKVYEVETDEETLALYAEWSATYDDGIAESGYASPARVAAALTNVGTDTAEPILDYGCGTGLSGVALRAAGFVHVDGADPSPEMISQAAAKRAYRTLTTLDLDQPPPFDHGQYRTITAIGVIGHGGAGIDVFDLLMGLLPAGGRFAFSFNDHALADPEYPGRVQHLLDEGSAKLLFREHGEHLPVIGLKSMVYVLEKQ